MAVVSGMIGGAVLSLIRVNDGVQMLGGEPSAVRHDQADSWILVESIEPRFRFTLRGGDVEVVCDFNPLFIDCDDTLT